MRKADLHCHSKYSEHPSEWFLKRIGASESYTEPETVYRLAKERGMDFVTITDHNKIDGVMQLCENHPNDCFTGVEATAYFPEDNCKIHVLIYGLTPEEYQEIEHFRKDIYQLREYLQERKLAHSVAHATYSVNGKLTLAHLEKLLLLFNVFESKNGGRNRLHNHSWTTLTSRLTSDDIERLYQKHRIEPIGDTPWKKGYTAGSDDHAGLFIGETWTSCTVDLKDKFLESIRNGNGLVNGRNNDYRSLVYTVYKIAYDYSTQKESFAKPLFYELNRILFENRSPSTSNKLKMNGMILLSRLRLNRHKKSPFLKHLQELIHDIDREVPTTEKLNLLVNGLAKICDDLLVELVHSIEKDLLNGEIEKMFGRIIGALPGVFLSVPFLTSYSHLHRNRNLIDRAFTSFHIPTESKRLLWFTDTLTHLNGVAMTMQTIGKKAMASGQQLRIAATLSEEERASGEFPYVIDLPSIHEFTLPYYTSYKIQIPSLLRSLQIIDQFDPDEIYISTPGPLGLLGLLIAKLSKIPVSGIFHTDFTLQIDDITGNDGLHNVSEAYMRWFYGQCDKILVPTAEYIDIMADRGLPRERMSLFRRGIDCELFRPNGSARKKIELKYQLTDKPKLLFAGRVSRDKNLDFLLEVFRGVCKTNPYTQLIIAGDGPYLSAMKRMTQTNPNVFYTGKLSQAELAELYAGCDLLLLTSTTDTFGMVVLEALSSGLIPIVSDIGGPQELIDHNENGYLAKANDLEDWVSVTNAAIEILSKNPEKFSQFRENARKSAMVDSDWEQLINEIVGGSPQWNGRSASNKEQVVAQPL